MFDILISPSMMPFSMAIIFLVALVILELIAILIGTSLFGSVGEFAPDVGSPDFGDIDLSTIEMDDIDFGDARELIHTHSGPMAWLGIGRVPFMIWLVVALATFGITGFVIQNIAMAAMGTPLNVWVAAGISCVIALICAARFSQAFAAILPQIETTAVDKYHLARRRGIITQGTARRGSPAEVRVIDTHDNVHYLRAEPWRDQDVYPQGTEVLVLRDRRIDAYRLLAISEIYNPS